MSKEKHWVWDLYPLSAKAWANGEIETDALAGHELVRYGPTRYRVTYGDGSSGSPTRTKRRGYRPNENDLAILRRVFPDGDPENPSWPSVKAKLVVDGGHDHAKLVELDAPILLGMLDKLTRQPAGKGIPATDADQQAQTASIEQLTVSERIDLLQKAVEQSFESFYNHCGVRSVGEPIDQEEQAAYAFFANAKKQIEVIGPRIATDLIRAGRPAQPLLQFLVHVSDGNEPEAEKEWPSIKSTLQEFKIQLSVDAQNDADSASLETVDASADKATPARSPKNKKQVEAILVGYASQGELYTTQKLLAKRLGVSVGMINNVITGNDILTGWMKLESKPKVGSLSSYHTNNTSQDIEDDDHLQSLADQDELARLVKEQAADDKSDYSHPKL